MFAICRQSWRVLVFLGFLGMFICGGMVYLALQKTTATNGTLIYTVPPVIILLIERFWRGRQLRKREVFGVTLAIAGVVIIIAKGSIQTLQSLAFNPGDLLFLMAAISWAMYSIVLKSSKLASLGTLPLFALISPFGALLLLPVAGYEMWLGENLPHTVKHWSIIGGIVLCSSLIAYSTFQHGVRILGASIAGIFMYLMPPFGVGFAWYFLGESIEGFHIAGIVAILSGVILATFPGKLLKRSTPV
jgi:drug/metabolite transporter (DMT)-like permease